jgi:glycosyltransferase-like protein
MRIALLTYSTKPRGGVVHTLALAESLVAQGQSVAVWTLARGGDRGFFRDVDAGVGMKLVPFPEQPEETVGERIVRSIAVLRQAFTPAEYDIVHAQDCISANAVDRCIRTIHHLDEFTTPELIDCHERAIVRPYAHICVSKSVAGDVRHGWGITPTVISNGVDAARFAAPDVGERQRWQQELGPYVLSVGGIEPRKGTDDLVEAMAIVQRSRPELSLVIGGGETLFDYRDYRNEVERRAADLGVRYTVLGSVDHKRLPALIAQAQVFAFPSRKEGFGMAAMEALAASVPVVMRDLPVLREVFSGAVRFAKTPAELAGELLKAPEATRQQAGRDLAAAHTWSGAAAAHLRFYRDNLERRRAPSAPVTTSNAGENL